ncbi:MAG: uncharacterized protein JWO30_885 [Fibrobacteres bacterium]|nr:uncharacterized protein [Fibrobacterota bacterium]
MRANFRLLGFTLFLVFLSACSKKFPEYWISDLQPQSTFEEVSKKLGLDQSKYQVVEDHHLAQGDRRPRFDILAIEFQWEDLGSAGNLRLKFYNGILSEAWFFPINYEGYLKTMVDKKGINLIRYPEGKCRGKFKIIRGIDYKNRPYILWEDIKTSEERERWIWKYS